MRYAFLSLALGLPALVACGSGQQSSSSSAQTTTSVSNTFDPPPAPAGYTRLTAVTVPNIPPGGDVTYCQYLMAPFDHDVDVLDVGGYQSKYGHHAVAFSFSDTSVKLGTSFPCMGTEFTSGSGASADGGASSDAGSDSTDLALGAYLGGVGGGTGGGNVAALPAGVAFRLKKGNGVMLNVHYLNTGEDTIDGNSVLDIEFAPVDPTRKIAAMFVNLNLGFDILPAETTTSSTECVAQSDVQFLMMANHMHEYGSSATTQVIRAGTGAIEDMHDDPRWTSDMQFNLVTTGWPVDAPFILHQGDTIRTTCTWQNPTTADIEFPREMCVGVGFALATAANPSAPSCTGGTWVPDLL